MRRSLTAFVAVALVGGATPLFAQSVGDAAAYVALVSTPVGALPPMLAPALAGAEGTRPTFGVRYGYVDVGVGLHALSATVDLPVGTRGSSFGLSAGYQFVNCDVDTDCQGNPMVGGSFDTRLARTAGTSPVSVGLSTAIGAAFPNGGKFYSASVGVPIILEVSTTSGGRVAPFIAPGLGWGRMTLSDALLGDFSRSGVRPMLGAGVTIVTTRGMNFGLGIQKVVFDDGDVQVGAGFSFGRPRGN